MKYKVWSFVERKLKVYILIKKEDFGLGVLETTILNVYFDLEKVKDICKILYDEKENFNINYEIKEFFIK